MNFKCLDNSETNEETNVDLCDQHLTDEIPMVNDDDSEYTWISCAGHLEAISNEFKQCSEMLNNIKNSKCPNPVIFLIKVVYNV